MKYFTLLIALLLFGFAGFAQFRILGKVTQELDKVPLEGANIILKELNLVSVSSANGHGVRLPTGGIPDPHIHCHQSQGPGSLICFCA